MFKEVLLSVGKIFIKMLTLTLNIYIKMNVSVVATTFFSLRMLMKTASRMLYE